MFKDSLGKYRTKFSPVDTSCDTISGNSPQEVSELYFEFVNQGRDWPNGMPTCGLLAEFPIIPLGCQRRYFQPRRQV